MAADPLEDLRNACGDEYAAPAADTGCVAGHRPRFVARPSSTAEVSAVMRVATGHGLRVVARGRGTRLDWGSNAEAVDLVLDCSRLSGVVEYNPADLVVQARAGTTLAEVAMVCFAHGQTLALDPPGGGTLGGIIAANASGPLRMSRGTCRDLLIGVTAVLADGTVASSGGKVVKNVAGYDLGKLYTGSLGTLGIVTEAVFRLHPLPSRRLFAMADYADADAACAAAARVRRAQLAVAALEVDRPSPDAPLTVAALLTGAGGVDGRAERAAQALGEGTTVTEEMPAWWGTPPGPAGGTALKLAVRLTALPAILTALAAPAGRVSSGEAEQAWAAVRGSIGAGVLYAGLGADVPTGDIATLLDSLRAGLAAADGVGGAAGSVVVLRTPEPNELDLWGPVTGLSLMRRVKESFDPQRLLSPGRFVGGI